MQAFLPEDELYWKIILTQPLIKSNSISFSRHRSIYYQKDEDIFILSYFLEFKLVCSQSY